MGKLKIPEYMDESGQHSVKMEILKLAIEMLKNSNWAEKGDVEDEIKNAVNQLTASYNEL
jgi:single-stranded DNA-binding protein